MKKQAILIIAHNNIWTLEKLLKSLDSKYFDIYIHIDKKSNINNLDVIAQFVKVSKIYIYKEINVRWSDYSQVECELFLLEKALQNGEYSYFHLLSGVDLPLKKSEIIYNYFNEAKNKEFIHFYSEELPIEKYCWLKYFWLFRKYSRNSKILYLLEFISISLQKLININRLKKHNLKFMTGANWFSITKEFSEYLLSKKNFIYTTFKNTKSADEIFLQTILFNSPFKKNLFYSKYDDNYISCMRAIDWKRGNPYVYVSSDLNELVNSPYLFARKFDENLDKEIIEKIYSRNYK